MSYKHFSIQEREKILFFSAMGLTLSQIAKELGRHKSTITRELGRNPGEYSPSKAQAAYVKRRRNCCPKKRLSDAYLFIQVSILLAQRGRLTSGR